MKMCFDESWRTDFMTARSQGLWKKAGITRLAWIAVLYVTSSMTYATAQQNNGIHVGSPKVYDSRELTLMLDNLSEQLQNKNFVDPKALAAALGNIQGYQSSDFSLSAFANGAVGPQAASVFAGTGAGSTTPPSSTGTSNAPTVTINVAPTQNAGSSTGAATGGASTSAPLGPQSPALPTLQTPPNYNPTFGSNGSDLLSDEVNLTYQLYNVRMLLDRSLTDRLHGDHARLQAVVGFDIDLEPDKDAKNAAAIVQVTANLASPPPTGAGCDSEVVSLVALMPEQGSHNAATLSQSAYGFGGAIASSVFSFGVAGQKRSQVFYLYRDMDTLSFEKPATDKDPLIFGWQFRPVLGRKSVDPGLRHMLVVLGLPCSDTVASVPQITMSVTTQWQKYDSKTQTISPKQAHRTDTGSAEFKSEVPSTQSSQDRLKPQVSKVSWYPTDTGDGVAIVTGDNFFPGTTVRLGNRNLSSAADGLTIKSDKELELAVPLTAAVVGGVVSGRYGQAAPLESLSTTTPSSGFSISSLRVFPSGNDMFQINARLAVDPRNKTAVTVEDLKSKLNPPVALINGVPLAVRPFFSSPDITLTTFAPAEVVAKMASFTITFPFAGSAWSSSIPYYETTLKVARLGDDKEARLLISATNAADLLCTEWALQLDSAVEFPLTDLDMQCANPRTQRLRFTIPASDLKASDRALKCLESKSQTLSLDVPTGDIKPINAQGCVEAKSQTLVLELPAKDLTDSVKKCVDPKTHKLTLTVPGRDLDPPSVAFKCVDPKRQTVSFDYPAKDLKPYHRFLLVNRPKPTKDNPEPVPRSPLIGDIPKPEPPPPGPSLDKDQKVSVKLNDVHPVKFTGKHLDEVTKVLFDKTELRIVSQEDKAIVISLPPLVTGKVRDEVGLQLLSEGNDPVIAKLSVTATKAPTVPAPTTPPKKGK
jgi:hypothetical protein